MNLNVYDCLPEGFLETGFRELERVLPGPSLIRLAGQADPPLLLATLLHGNEPTGLMAVQKLLRSYRDAGEKLPRSLYLFVGNPAAAAQNVRHLPGHRITSYNVCYTKLLRISTRWLDGASQAAKTAPAGSGTSSPATGPTSRP